MCFTMQVFHLIQMGVRGMARNPIYQDLRMDKLLIRKDTSEDLIKIIVEI